MIKTCYKFLVGFTRQNLMNQSILYDHLDTFMRHIDRFPMSVQLLFEIFRDNNKFLTLNVSKPIKQIINLAEEAPLTSGKKCMYLKLLEVFCRCEGKLVGITRARLSLS